MILDATSCHLLNISIPNVVFSSLLLSLHFLYKTNKTSSKQRKHPGCEVWSSCLSGEVSKASTSKIPGFAILEVATVHFPCFVSNTERFCLICSILVRTTCFSLGKVQHLVTVQKTLQKQGRRSAVDWKLLYQGYSFSYFIFRHSQ